MRAADCIDSRGIEGPFVATCPACSSGVLLQVTVNARESEAVDGTCTWFVSFDTNTGREEDGGELPLLEASFYDFNRSSYGQFSSSIVDVRSHRSRLFLVRGLSSTSTHCKSGS